MKRLPGEINMLDLNREALKIMEIVVFLVIDL